MSVIPNHRSTVLVLPAATSSVSYIAANGNKLYNVGTGRPTENKWVMGAYMPEEGTNNHTAVGTFTNAQLNRAIKFIQRIDFDRSGPLGEQTFRESDIFVPKFGIPEFSVENASIGLYQLTSLNLANMYPTDNNNFEILSSVQGPSLNTYGHRFASNAGPYGFFRSPNFTALGTDTEAARDLIIQNLVATFNDTIGNNVSSSTVAMALSSVQSGNAITITAAAALPVGTSLILGYSIDGNPLEVIINQQIKDSFNALPAATKALYIIPYLIPQTALGTTPAGVANAAGDVEIAGTQGTSVVAEQILFLTGHTSSPAYDTTIHRHETLDVTLGSGWEDQILPRKGVVLVTAKDAIGHSDFITYHLSAIQGSNEGWFAPGRPWEALSGVKIPTGVVEGGYYDVFVLGGQTHNMTNNGTYSGELRRIWICVPNTVVGGSVEANANYTGTANPDRAKLITLLNSYKNINSGGFADLV